MRSDEGGAYQAILEFSSSDVRSAVRSGLGVLSTRCLVRGVPPQGFLQVVSVATKVGDAGDVVSLSWAYR